jgi:hypothetical protein
MTRPRSTPVRSSVSWSRGASGLPGTSTPLAASSVKPALRARTSYSPAGRSRSVNRPASSLALVEMADHALFSSRRASTTAPGTGRP